MENTNKTGYPHIDKPWLKYYSQEAIDAPLPEGSLYDYMTACTQDRLDCTALRYFGKKITYREFRRRIAACAGALAARGVKKGDMVSVCVLTMPEALVLLYAINYVGAVCNFLVLNATEQEMHDKLALTESRLLFTVDLAAEKAAKAAKGTAVEEIVCVPLSASMPLPVALGARLKTKATVPAGLTPWKAFLKAGKGTQPPKAAVDSHDLAVLEYTSGTTGESKGAMLSNQAVNTVLFHYGNSSTVFEFYKGEKYLCIVPPFLSIGLIAATLAPLCIGFEVILDPDPAPNRTAENVKRYRPNHFIAAPLHVNDIIHSPITQKMDLSFLSTVGYGGEKCEPHWEQEVTEFIHSHGIKHEIANGYGLTETSATICVANHKTPKLVPFCKNNILIRDVDTGEALSFGQEGEICVTGPSLMTGYYKKPEATAEVIFEENGVRWLRTGDLGMVTEDGAFHITGRLKRIFWGLGESNTVYRIYPMAIEEIICRCPGVAHCGVVGLPDKAKGYLPIAFVVPKNRDADQDALRREILALTQRELNSVSQPHAIRFLDNLPTTRAGKVDFRALEKLAQEAGR